MCIGLHTKDCPALLQSKSGGCSSHQKLQSAGPDASGAGELVRQVPHVPLLRVSLLRPPGAPGAPALLRRRPAAPRQLGGPAAWCFNRLSCFGRPNHKMLFFLPPPYIPLEKRQTRGYPQKKTRPFLGEAWALKKASPFLRSKTFQWRSLSPFNGECFL